MNLKHDGKVKMLKRSLFLVVLAAFCALSGRAAFAATCSCEGDAFLAQVVVAYDNGSTYVIPGSAATCSGDCEGSGNDAVTVCYSTLANYGECR